MEQNNENKEQKENKMEKRKAMAVRILLIAWNPSGELETLPSDQPPASLALSLRRRRTARELHISFTKQYVTCSTSALQWMRCYKTYLEKLVDSLFFYR